MTQPRFVALPNEKFSLVTFRRNQRRIGLRVVPTIGVSNPFSELFHKATAMTFTDYVARVRVEKVKNLLQNPRLQITTIAYDTGFQSLSQFNRVFKRVTGVTPRVYRAGLGGAA